jgi:hypothetical protein
MTGELRGPTRHVLSLAATRFAGSQDQIRFWCRTGSGLSTEAEPDLGDLSHISAEPKHERSGKQNNLLISGHKLQMGYRQTSFDLGITPGTTC